MHLYKQLLIVIAAEVTSAEDQRYVFETVWNLSKEYAVIEQHVTVRNIDELVTEEPADYLLIFTRVDGKLTHELKPYESKITQESTEAI